MIIATFVPNGGLQIKTLARNLKIGIKKPAFLFRPDNEYTMYTYSLLFFCIIPFNLARSTESVSLVVFSVIVVGFGGTGGAGGLVG
jgi:hypothetical protein